MRCLLMGGQACVLYGGAEFSRDTDLAVLSDEDNLDRLARALEELQAERIAVPPFERRFLDMGLAVHFRSQHPESNRMRIDLMTRMRGVDSFDDLWVRRTSFEFPEGVIDAMSLPDLVLAKKTQRDKDWPMLTRLVDVSFLGCESAPTDEQIRFWLMELRTPRYLIEAAQRFPDETKRRQRQRPLLEVAQSGDRDALSVELRKEEDREREADAAYWRPLREELERLRQSGA